MNYLIVQDWPSTHGNHAGMVHLCRLLVEAYPDEYTVLQKEQQRKFKQTENWLLRKLVGLQVKYYTRITFKHEYQNLCKPMYSQLKAGDKVFLLEYMFPYASQLEIAQYIKQNHPKVKVYGLCHLTRTFFKDATIYPSLLRKWPCYVDRLLTFGHSLTDYFIEMGVPSDKISTGLHYVDARFYGINEIKQCSSKMRAIVMGGMQRNYAMLTNIVKGTPDVEWIICRGRDNTVDTFFHGSDNVILKGFLQEEELRDLMGSADLSVNIMADTIGSNVVTTSLSMGLAMVCSDVGSIRDYCDDTNAVFCQNKDDDFITAINGLVKHPDKVLSMKNASWDKSKQLGVDYVHGWFMNL